MNAAVARLAQRPSLRIGAVTVTLVLLAVGAWEGWTVWSVALRSPNHPIGRDVDFYLNATRSWLAGTGFYRPEQLVGVPYQIQDGDVLYPPPTLLLFLPWTLGTPMILWWLAPMAAIGFAVWSVRPSRYASIALALTLVYPRTWAILVYGNPSMWALGAIAAGCVWGWPSAGALVKPVFWPFALLGLRRAADRRAVLGLLGVMILVGLLFVPLWLQYAVVISTSHSAAGADYVLGELPIGLLVAVALWSDPSSRLEEMNRAPLSRG